MNHTKLIIVLIVAVLLTVAVSLVVKMGADVWGVFESPVFQSPVWMPVVAG